MKVVIDIPQQTWALVREGQIPVRAYECIVKGTPLRCVLDEILDEAEYAYADFDRYKEDILHAEPDELPDNDFRYGMERAVAIINKYKAESEE